MALFSFSIFKSGRVRRKVLESEPTLFCFMLHHIGLKQYSKHNNVTSVAPCRAGTLCLAVRIYIGESRCWVNTEYATVLVKYNNLSPSPVFDHSFLSHPLKECTSCMVWCGQYCSHQPSQVTYCPCLPPVPFLLAVAPLSLFPRLTEYNSPKTIFLSSSCLSRIKITIIEALLCVPEFVW